MFKKIISLNSYKSSNVVSLSLWNDRFLGYGQGRLPYNTDDVGRYVE